MTAYQSAQIQLHLARAAWWTAYANSPANLARRVKVGLIYSTEYLCKSQLIDEAMETANTHLSNAQKVLDTAAL